MIDYDKEHQAWELLQWQIWSLPGEFDEDLAAKGYYTTLDWVYVEPSAVKVLEPLVVTMEAPNPDGVPSDDESEVSL